MKQLPSEAFTGDRMKAIPAKQLLHEYAALQERLCEALFEQYPVDDANLLTDLPQQGQLPLDDALWEFLRHGSGVCFTHVSTHEVVDVPTYPVACPRGIDGWRLCQHLESRNIEILNHGPTEFDARNEKALERMLHQLSHEGVLDVIDLKRRIYSLRPTA